MRLHHCATITYLLGGIHRVSFFDGGSLWPPNPCTTKVDQFHEIILNAIAMRLGNQRLLVVERSKILGEVREGWSHSSIRAAENHMRTILAQFAYVCTDTVGAQQLAWAVRVYL